MLTTYYVPTEIKPGDTIAYGSLEREPYTGIRYGYETPSTQRLNVIDLASFSDHSGGDVERSNHRVMLDDSDIAPHLVRLHGSHGTEAIGFLGDPDAAPEAIQDALASLDRYCILDNDDHSSLACEIESKAWQDWGRKDFRRALVSVLEHVDPEHEHDIDAIEDSTIDETWYAGCDAFNVNGGSGYVIETGGHAWFYIDEWCEKATEHDRDRSEWSRAARAMMHDTLVDLARLSRIVESD